MIVPRAWVLLMLLLGVGALAGCSVDGRIEVVSPTAVNLDLTVRGERSPYCDGDIDGLSVTPGNDPGGIVTSCHYVGTVNPSALGGAIFALNTIGEYTALVLNPYGDSDPGTGSDTIQTLDVTLVLPGDVVEHNSGVVQGREVRLTDPKLLQLPGGFRVVALNHAGPPYWLWWTGAALVLGTGIGWGASSLLRRRLRRARGVAEGADSSETEPAAERHDTGDPGDSDDQAGRRDAADRAEAPGWALGEPNGLHLHSESTVHASADPSVRSRPDQSPTSADVRDPDPSRWAPDA